LERYAHDVVCSLSERSADLDESDSVSSTVYIVGGVVGGVLLLILTILVSRHCRRRRSSAVLKSKNSAKIRRKPCSSNLSEDQTSTLLPTGSVAIDLGIAPSSVQILQFVGNARFGTVYIGNVFTESAASNYPVIVKTLAGGTDSLTRELFIARTQAMVGLRHCNVLGLVGACLQQTGQSGIISALYEHHDGVDLNTFLHRQATLSRSPYQIGVLMKLAVDCSCGLAYLSEHWITHGDVASNSILVVIDDAGCAVTAKICDLGLSSPWCACCSSQRHNINCLSTPVASCGPAVWPQHRTIPELLLYGHVAITEASDVWQFGLVLYQINCVIRHQHLVAIVMDCRSDDPSQRPRFKEIHHRLMAASVTFDPACDPDVDHEVTWGSRPSTSNETGFSLLTVHPADTVHQHPNDDDDVTIDQHPYHHHQQPCGQDNTEIMSDGISNQDTCTRSAPPHTSSHDSSQVII